MAAEVRFQGPGGRIIPALTTAQMRRVDRLAVEVFHLSLLQMMENAGRNLAQVVMARLEGRAGPVVVLAGPAGNGGGGLCCARHLHNRGVEVAVVLARPALEMSPAARAQWSVLYAAGLRAAPLAEADSLLPRASLVVDALIGYGLQGAPHGAVRDLILRCNNRARRVISLDVPSGIDATRGLAPGQAVRAHVVVTLALPKTGLAGLDAELILADLGIPPQLYQQLGLSLGPIFQDQDWFPIQALPAPSQGAPDAR